jgi:hypothetical protein
MRILFYTSAENTPDCALRVFASHPVCGIWRVTGSFTFQLIMTVHAEIKPEIDFTEAPGGGIAALRRCAQNPFHEDGPGLQQNLGCETIAVRRDHGRTHCSPFLLTTF